MRKYLKFTILPVLFLLLGMLFLKQDPLPGWDAPTELPKRYQREIQQEILQAEALLETASSSDIDTQEALLITAGYPTLDTDAVYPAYLANSDALTDFWASASVGEDACVSLLRITQDDTLRHLFFFHENGETLFFFTDVVRDAEQTLSVLRSEILPVYEMELAEWGIFYYRLYPAGDPHYIDYNQIRLQSVDRELYDLNRKYILPVGYQMVNLFLCDWQEGHWGNLSFHDLLEYLYAMNTGKTLSWEQYPRVGYPSRIQIPAALFENTILPYFQVSLEEFRSICQYDAAENCYLWRPIHGDDLTTWHYPMCEPEVMGYTENSDGTITLDIQVYSPELKTDRLFCHSLTIRPMADGGFQYVSNQVTYVSDRGLPPNMPRFELDE